MLSSIFLLDENQVTVFGLFSCAFQFRDMSGFEAEKGFYFRDHKSTIYYKFGQKMVDLTFKTNVTTS